MWYEPHLLGRQDLAIIGLVSVIETGASHIVHDLLTLQNKAKHYDNSNFFLSHLLLTGEMS